MAISTSAARVLITVIAPELLEDRGDVRLHRALLDRQASGDLLVQQTFGKQAEYARLLFGEAGQTTGEIGIGRIDGQGGDGLGQSGWQPGAAVDTWLIAWPISAGLALLGMKPDAP